ncbi:MAG TPA: hypothetical protein VHZ09_08385 [Acidobacteriaceae bacterium]|nr:hypothetical protein [Acidobacteriaceae bacterium]
MTTTRRFTASALVFATSCMGQSPHPPPTLAEPVAMPADVAADSYAIYSSLMPLGETANKSWPHEYWLVREATVTAVPPKKPCRPEKPAEPESEAAT